jgi:hypothetical protein
MAAVLVAALLLLSGYLGNADAFTTISPQNMSAGELDVQFGWSVAFLGDIDGDSTPELGVSSRPDWRSDAAGGGSQLGAVWILFMHQNGTVRRQQSVRSGYFQNVLGPDDQFGISLCAVGDVDGELSCCLIGLQRFPRACISANNP